uniref:Ig-like domain-containing protein n=1 Tax=Sphaeramia orbicularis TaxID=375764 RepID=A0A672YEJ3_9TELE
MLSQFRRIHPVSLLSTKEHREDKVTQPTGDVTAVQGLTLTLQCTFETSDTNPTLFWYKQEVNDYPRYIFDAEINRTSFLLKIEKLHVSDSAVYYCAVRPTVTGNSKTLNKNLWMAVGEPCKHNSCKLTSGTRTSKAERSRNEGACEPEPRAD